jgi:mRNA interferase HigB
MRVIAYSTLRTFCQTHTDAQDALREWYRDVSKANWQMPQDAKEYASSVSILTGDRLCFNIKGNT